MLPGLVFALYVTNTPILPEWRIEMIAYSAHQVNDDGGWGLFPGGNTMVWTTALYYVLLRLLGVLPSDPLAARARERLLLMGMCWSEQERCLSGADSLGQVALLVFLNGVNSGSAF